MNEKKIIQIVNSNLEKILGKQNGRITPLLYSKLIIFTYFGGVQNAKLQRNQTRSLCSIFNFVRSLGSQKSVFSHREKIPTKSKSARTPQNLKTKQTPRSAPSNFHQ